MIFKEIEQKPVEYVILLLIFIVSGFCLVNFNHVQFLQRITICLTAVLYFIWSLFHHYRRGDLHLSVVIEYLLFIFFGLIILATL